MGNRDPQTSFPWFDGPRSLPWAGALQKAMKPIIPTSAGSVYANYLGSCSDADFIRCGSGVRPEILRFYQNSR